MYTRTCAYQGVEIVSFTENLRTYSALKLESFHRNRQKQIGKSGSSQM